MHKLITTLFAVAACHAQSTSPAKTPFTPIANRFGMKTFSDNRTEIAVYEDDFGLMPVVRTKEAGDAAQVTVLYNHTAEISGKKVDLVLSKTVVCPLVEGVDCACDEVYGVRLSDVAWVRVKFLKTLEEFEIGRKPAKAEGE